MKEIESTNILLKKDFNIFLLFFSRENNKCAFEKKKKKPLINFYTFPALHQFLYAIIVAYEKGTEWEK